MTYDAIVIGSRVAGSATAMLLARRGYRVLLTDRATFPSDTISTHCIWHPGIAHLMNWGLLNRVAETNAPPIDTAEFDFGAFALRTTPPPAGPATSAYAPRRTLLDKILVDAAAEAGAEIREGFSIQEIVFDGGRAAGVRGHTMRHEAVVERAKVIIGADGVHSTVARALQPTEDKANPPLTCWYYSYWSGIANRGIRFFSRPGSAFGCMPTNDGLMCVPIAWPRDRFPEVRSDIEGYYLKALSAAPSLKEELLSGRREERFYGSADIPNYLRKPYGDGWALVGDAGYHKDPILAQGISDAFRDASLLAGGIDDVFSGRAVWAEAMARYESTRNAAVGAMYEMNLQFASLEPPPPEVQAILEALRHNQKDANQWAGTLTGAVPISDFYAPANVARILGSAGQSKSASSRQTRRAGAQA